jgi:peptidyl-prolyl cis-trans isomerase SurA
MLNKQAGLVYRLIQVVSLSSVMGMSAHALAQNSTVPVPAKLEAKAETKAEAKQENKADTKSAINKAIKLNRIAVVVNDEVITEMEVNEKIAQIEKSLAGQNAALPNRADLQKQVIERLIVDKTQIQLAKENGMRVDEPTLDRMILRIAEQNKMNLQQLRTQVEREGTPFSVFREELREDYLKNRIREREVDSKVQVSESEVDAFLLTEETALNDKNEYKLLHIMVGLPDNATPDVIAKRGARAQEALKKLRIGENFAKLAALYSDSPEGAKGGDLGWREPDRLPPPFNEALSKMDINGLSDVIRTPAGFHIIKLIEKRALAVKAQEGAEIAQTNVRHILIKPSQVMPASMAKSTLADIRQKILSKTATFEEMAKAHSNDTSSQKGGELGWIYPGDAPEFEQVMNKLAVNELSEPVETQFGWHLIQVTERKMSDQSQDKKRLAARQAVRARKVEEMAQDWMRQLRDRAYVELRLDQK